MAQLEEKISRLEQERMELLATIEKGEGFDAAIQQIQQDNVRSVDIFSRIKFNRIFSRYLQARLQEELAKSKSTISAMESQQKVKTDVWIAGESRLKEEKMKLQEQLSNLSNELDSTKEKQVHLQKLFDDANREITDWQNKCHHLESKMSEMEKHNLLQVSSCCC